MSTCLKLVKENIKTPHCYLCQVMLCDSQDGLEAGTSLDSSRKMSYQHPIHTYICFFVLYVFPDCFSSCPSLPILIACPFILINVLRLGEDEYNCCSTEEIMHLERISQLAKMPCIRQESLQAICKMLIYCLTYFGGKQYRMSSKLLSYSCVGGTYRYLLTLY